MTRQEWVRRARRALHALDEMLHGDRIVIPRDPALDAARHVLRGRLARLESEAWPSPSWHRPLVADDDLVLLLVRAECRAGTSERYRGE